MERREELRDLLFHPFLIKIRKKNFKEFPEQLDEALFY
jgi:hypothetical protein